VRKADNQPPSSADVTESGSLNLPEPSGPHRPGMGMLYLFYTSNTEVHRLDRILNQFHRFLTQLQYVRLTSSLMLSLLLHLCLKIGEFARDFCYQKYVYISFVCQLRQMHNPSQLTFCCLFYDAVSKSDGKRNGEGRNKNNLG
jgi:hypothetical protein